MASVTQQGTEEFLQKLLAEMSPEDEQYLMQLLAENAPAAGPLREVVQNILDERIPLEERLPKPLLARKYPPKAPPRQQSGIVINFDNHVTSQHGGHFRNRGCSYLVSFIRYLFGNTRVIYQ